MHESAGSTIDFCFYPKISGRTLYILIVEMDGGETITFVTKHVGMYAKSLQSCATLCDPINCSLPDSSVHGILQERILEWVAMPSFRESSQTRDRTFVSYVSCIGRQVLYH